MLIVVVLFWFAKVVKICHFVHLFLSILEELGEWGKILGKPYVTSYDGIMTDGYAAEH